MKKFLGLLFLGLLAAVTFPGSVQTLDAQPDKTVVPVSTNPEIAALQARSAIIEKQMLILGQKLDTLLQQKTSTAEPIQTPPQPVPMPPPVNNVVTNADGTITVNGTLFLPASAACGQSTVSATAAACGASQSATAGSTHQGLFSRMRDRRAARRGAASGGCS
jgi:hypothetical protein